MTATDHLNYLSDDSCSFNILPEYTINPVTMAFDV